MSNTKFRQPYGSKLVCYEWQTEACKGNIIAAVILNLYLSEHLFLLEVKENTAIAWSQDQIKEKLFYTASFHKISTSLKLLVELGFLKPIKNPKPICNNDRTRCYLVQTKAIDRWLEKNSWRDS